MTGASLCSWEMKESEPVRSKYNHLLPTIWCHLVAAVHSSLINGDNWALDRVELLEQEQ